MTDRESAHLALKALEIFTSMNSIAAAPPLLDNEDRACSTASNPERLRRSLRRVLADGDTAVIIHCLIHRRHLLNLGIARPFSKRELARVISEPQTHKPQFPVRRNFASINDYRAARARHKELVEQYAEFRRSVKRSQAKIEGTLKALECYGLIEVKRVARGRLQQYEVEASALLCKLFGEKILPILSRIFSLEPSN